MLYINSDYGIYWCYITKTLAYSTLVYMGEGRTNEWFNVDGFIRFFQGEIVILKRIFTGGFFLLECLQNRRTKLKTSKVDSNQIDSRA